MAMIALIASVSPSVFRASTPMPGQAVQEGVESQGALGFLNLFSGGAFGSFSIFALGIMPYITASIIMQVLGVVIPKLEKLQQEGAVGQRKITQYTRYLAIGISTLQATALTFIFGNGNGNAFFGAAQRLPSNVKLLPDGMWPRGYLVILTLVAGTAVLMWIGELISQRGIGNGMSMIIFASVVSRPAVRASTRSCKSPEDAFVFILLVIVSLLIVVAVVRVELAQRRIPVQFAKRVVGRRMYGGQNTYIPLKVNQSGVVPIIFASSVLLLPVLLTNLLGGSSDPKSWRVTIQKWVDSNLVNSQNIVYIALFSLLIVAFAYFYNSIAFDPIRQADQIRRQGGFIPGVRPGPQTERYLAKAVNRITLPGAVFVAVIAITAVPAPVGVRRAELPVRRYHRADRRRRRTRTDASDRQSIDAAQLRGLPEVILPRLVKGGSSAA